jgi:hypothetical protein
MVNSTRASSQNGFCSYKLSFRKKTNIVLNMAKNITLFLTFLSKNTCETGSLCEIFLEFCKHHFVMHLEIPLDSDTRFSPSGFFHKSVSLGHLSIPLGPFQIFSKIRRDIRE